MSRKRKSESKKRQPPAKPRWERASRTLWFRGRVVKRFKGRATCQMALLDFLESTGWPKKIEDALPAFPAGRNNRKRTLHDAIKRLNRDQHIIRFHGYAEGHGISWEILED